MTSNQVTIIILLLLIVGYIIVFIVGYILGKLSVGNGVYNITDTNQKIVSSSNSKNITSIPTNKVSIDDTKVVIDIKTSNLEKKYDSLGDIKQTNENISSSINKLKNMKG